jgi:hypothetical protein
LVGAEHCFTYRQRSLEERLGACEVALIQHQACKLVSLGQT